VRVAIVDGSEIFRLGLCALLAREAGFQIVGEFPDAELPGILEATPQLVLTDLVLASGNGIALTRQLRLADPSIRVMVLADRHPIAIVHQIMTAGAHGFVIKSRPAHEILHGIRRVAAGEQVFPNPIRLVSVRKRSPTAPGTAKGLGGLSAREREVFLLVIWGSSNRAIAERLGISIKTVETHRAHLNEKLGCRGCADMVRLASFLGIFSQGEAARTTMALPRS
jgi:two-component system, NarL family, response regulator NreC